MVARSAACCIIVMRDRYFDIVYTGWSIKNSTRPTAAMISNIETWLIISAFIVVRSVMCIQNMFKISTILAYVGPNAAGKIVNYAAACRSVNCPRLSFNVIHKLHHSGWTVLVHLLLQIPHTVQSLWRSWWITLNERCGQLALRYAAA